MADENGNRASFTIGKPGSGGKGSGTGGSSKGGTGGGKSGSGGGVGKGDAYLPPSGGKKPDDKGSGDKQGGKMYLPPK